MWHAKMHFSAKCNSLFYTVVSYQALFRLSVYKIPAVHLFGCKKCVFCTIRDFGSPTIVQYTLDRYRSICSAIKCPLEITADDYFVALHGAVYDAIQAAYIVLRIMGYLRVSCLPSTIILPASVCLPICMFCSCDCLCERTTRNTQS